MYVPFNELPGYSRVWIYQSDRRFSPNEEITISEELNDFCTKWVAHGNPLKASFRIEFNHFIILAVDETAAGASGCSIDGSVRTLKGIGAELGIELFDRTKIAFFTEGRINIHPIKDINALFQSGTLLASTITFNNLVADKSNFDTQWKTPVEKTWLAKYLPKNALSA